MITIGVDPGVTGAVGVLNNGEYLALFDIPTTFKGSGSTVKYEVDPSGFKRQLFRYALDTPGESVCAGLERVNAMPGQGVASVFSLGDSFGCCRSVLATSDIPFDVVTPAKWKKYFSLTSDKEESRALAVRLFPTAELHLKKHADRAEALLIARYVWETKFK